jgi:quercetin dioxygenase-like cupin family protein
MGHGAHGGGVETRIAQATLLTEEQIDRLPQSPLGELKGITNRVLWRDATSMAGVLTVDGGQELGAHAHRANHHHFWVLDGEAEVLGTMVRPGSYVHIPAGIEHNIDARETEGCTVYYLYLLPGA